jgi:hypothetical protein
MQLIEPYVNTSHQISFQPSIRYDTVLPVKFELLVNVSLIFFFDILHTCAIYRPFLFL